MTDHPITPPPELVQQWLCSENYSSPVTVESTITITGSRLQKVATQAARWGANMELDACCKEILFHPGFVEQPELFVELLLNKRRPKPPSLKEQATFAAAVLQSPDETCSIAEIAQHWHTIRRALEALPND